MINSSKDNPLEFTFWRKMLRDVREMLKADALEKLKKSCPTLYSMGWFKVCFCLLFILFLLIMMIICRKIFQGQRKNYKKKKMIFKKKKKKFLKIIKH